MTEAAVAPLFSPCLLINSPLSIPQPWPEILRIVFSPRSPAARNVCVGGGGRRERVAVYGGGRAHLASHGIPSAPFLPGLPWVPGVVGCEEAEGSGGCFLTLPRLVFKATPGSAFHPGLLTVACRSHVGPSCLTLQAPLHGSVPQLARSPTQLRPCWPRPRLQCCMP